MTQCVPDETLVAAPLQARKCEQLAPHTTEILLAPDGKSARVFISVQGDEREARQTLKAIEAAKGYMRRELLERMGVRHVPELTFMLDRSEEYGGRIDELLGRIKKRVKK